MRPPSKRLRASLLLAVAFALLTFVAPIHADDPAPKPPREGWTQIDIWQKGINPHSSPYTRETRCATVSLHVKNPEGEWTEKELKITMKKGQTFSQMAAAACAELLKCVKEKKWQFSFACTGNGITVWPINYDADPDKEGKPNNYPDNKKNRPKVRKESHPVKKNN